MGATLPFKCPVEGCSYETNFRLGMGEEMDGGAHAERFGILRAEHPHHPGTDQALPIKPGDAFPVSADDVGGDCPSIYQGPCGLAACVLDAGHAGQHVASDGKRVVETWS